MITSPFFGYYIFLPGTGTGCTWVVTTFVKTVSKDLSVSMPSRAWVVTAYRFKERLWQMRFNALSGLYLISTMYCWITFDEVLEGFNALSGLYLISTVGTVLSVGLIIQVSMPSRAYTSFLRCFMAFINYSNHISFQCPLGLIPHFYGTPSKT